MYHRVVKRQIGKRIVVLCTWMPSFVCISCIEVAPCIAQNPAFRRQSSANLPLVENLAARAYANSIIQPDEQQTDQNEILAHVTVHSTAADSGAFAEADGMGTAMALTPINSTTVAPTVDATYFLRAFTSEDAANARSFIDEGMIDAPATFQLEGTDPGTQLFLNGFVYIAENGGIVEVGDGANAQLDIIGMNANVNGWGVGGGVDVDDQGVKTAMLMADLPGLAVDNVEVGSINHLFHFVVPISIGNRVTMQALINGDGGRVGTLLPGDFASIQWTFKATAWAYVTSDIPQLTVGTSELLFGDYNNDGTVDAADYTVWRNTLGQTGTGLPADGDDDGVVDEDDCKIWDLTFGLTVTSLPESGELSFSLAVPEVASFVNYVLSLLVVTSSRYASIFVCRLSRQSIRQV